MLVVVPTYRRAGPVEWSLRSVFRATPAHADEDLRLLVVSNHPASHPAVAGALQRAIEGECQSARWKVDLLARPETLPPIENWYGAILDNANEGETVFLHGDDDMLCPGALARRDEVIRAIGADMLVTSHAGPLFFIGGNKALGPVPDLRDRPVAPVSIGFSSEILGNAPFIGNHTYRNTGLFRAALAETRHTCSRQDWLPADQRELMLPFYLPINLLRAGGKVGGLDQVFEWRGHDRRELIESPFRCAHWNNGFLYGATLDYLGLPMFRDITALDGQRALYRKLTSVLHAGVLADDRIPPEVRRSWRARMDQILPRTSFERVHSLWHILLESTGLARMKTRLALSMRPVIDLETDFLDRFFPSGKNP